LTRVYRILREAYSKNPLDGEGAFRFGGRWSSPGTRLVYTSEHLSLAMVEYFVHLNPDDPPDDLVVAAAEIPDSVSRVSIPARRLPAGWQQTPSPPGLSSFGDAFVQERRAAVLIVPSALTPHERNLLINPHHQDFKRIRLLPVAPFRYDPRFFR
jgi:RES domain-containing protein